MKFLFILPDFNVKNLRLQPWLTFHRVAVHLHSKNHEVFFLTDNKNHIVCNEYTVYFVKKIRNSSSSEILFIIKSINPDSIVLPITPLSLATSFWYKYLKEFRTFGFSSYPFYSFSEFFRAFKYLSFREKLLYGRHLFVPSYIWTRCLQLNFNGVICQSLRTCKKIQKMTNNALPIHSIFPGIDKVTWYPNSVSCTGIPKYDFLYVGGAVGIRGFSILLDAMTLIPDIDINLKILARNATNDQLRNFQFEVFRRGLESRVSIEGGWMDVADLRSELQSARVVLLPFVLVPSELPVSVMEAVACGSPVVVTNIDGLPDAAGDAGLVIPNGDVRALADALMLLRYDQDKYEKLKSACQPQSESMMSWDEMSCKWLELMSR